MYVYIYIYIYTLPICILIYMKIYVFKQIDMLHNPIYISSLCVFIYIYIYILYLHIVLYIYTVYMISLCKCLGKVLSASEESSSPGQQMWAAGTYLEWHCHEHALSQNPLQFTIPD